jgi:cysteine synthase
MNALPAANIKVLPGMRNLMLSVHTLISFDPIALNLLLRGKELGLITDKTHTIIEYSSGSTAISMAILCNIMGIPNMKAYMSNKTSETKLNLLRFFVRCFM